MTNIFSNRELAVAIWIAIVFVWAITQAGIRESIWSLIVSATARQLLVIWIIGGTWMALGVYLLSLFDFWDVGDLKDTIIWCCSAGVLVLIHGASRGEKSPDYRNLVIDLFKISIILEVLLSAYCFNLFVELLLVLVAAIAGLMQGISEIRNEHKHVQGFARGVLSIIGGAMIWRAISGVMHEPGEFWNLTTLKTVVHPMVLTFWVLPLSYAFGVMAAYEILFLPFRLQRNSDLIFNIRARFRLICHYGFRLSRVVEAPRQLKGRLYGVSSLSEIEDLLH